MLNFPTTPTDGQVFSGFTWRAAGGVWEAVPTSDVAAGNAEYTRYNGTWRKIYETFPIPNISMSNSVALPVPTGARITRWLFMAYFSGSPDLMFYMTIGGGAVFNTRYMGKSHKSGSLGFQTTQATATAGIRLGETVYTVGSAIATIMEGMIMTTRVGTQLFRGKISSQTYNANTTSYYCHEEQQVEIPSADAGANLVITGLTFTNDSGLPGVGAYAQMSWDYGS